MAKSIKNVKKTYAEQTNLIEQSLTVKTRSHTEMVGDMSRVTLNFDLSKFLLCISSQGQDLYSHQKLNMYI